MRQEVAFLPQRAKAKSERKPDGLVTEGIGMVGEEEGHNPELVRVTPGPFLKDTAPNANRKGAGNKNVVRGVRRGVQGEAMTKRAEISGWGGGSGSGADGEAPHMNLVDALSCTVRKGGGVCVGENSSNCQL